MSLTFNETERVILVPFPGEDTGIKDGDFSFYP